MARTGPTDVERAIGDWEVCTGHARAAGVYGTDAEHVPELRRLFGHPAVLLLVLAVCLVLARILRRNGWL